MTDVPSNLIPTRITQLPIAPVADENSLMMIVYQGNNYQIRVGDLLSVAGVPITRQVIAGTGMSGGGQLSSNVTLSIAPGGVGSSELANSGVTPGIYGDGSNIPRLTVDATGRVVAATSQPISMAGLGTVTSVGLDLPTDFTISGSPVTTSGTLTATWANQAQRKFLASPNNATGTPTFRAILASDVPTLNQNTTGQAGSVANSVTFNSSGGASPNTTFDGSAARTVDYSTVGAPKTDGTDATGTWNIGISGNAATATLATRATNVAGGAANKLVYNTGANTTNFVDAPTTGDTFLKWSGSAFTWASVASGGTVTSVDVSGGTTGLTTSGGPITASGTITLAGTLAVANGGTGATTASGALTALGAVSKAGDTMTGSLVVSTNSASNALRITQTGTGNALVVEDAANPDATPFVVDGSGNVGVGVLSPSSRLTVTGTGSPVEIYQNSASIRFSSSPNRTNNYYLGANISDSVNAGFIIGEGADIGTGTPRITINSSGNVGVGGAPGTDSRLRIEGTESRLRSANTTSGANAYFGAMSLNEARVWSVTNTPLTLGTSDLERMRITATGNVGINSSNPTARLNIVDNTSQDAVRITQTGAGNALVVEDSTNPDATPFVVDADGSLITGGTTRFTTATTGGARIQTITGSATISRFANDANPQRLEFVKSRSTTAGSPATVVQSGDTLGQVNWQGADGTAFVIAAAIDAAVDGTPGASDMPGRLVFSTTADGASSPTERMRIDAAGNVGIGTSSPGSRLQVAGTVTATAYSGINGGTF